MSLIDSLKKLIERGDKNRSALTPEDGLSPSPMSPQYYPASSYEGTPFERKVIPFDDRKATCIPSRNGLYVAEILLLEYCTYGKYPLQQEEYPRFWWFEYGLKDVNNSLISLERRGFLRFMTPRELVPKLKVAEIKKLLSLFNLPSAGKKDDIIKALLDGVSDAQLAPYINERRYCPTELGLIELNHHRLEAGGFGLRLKPPKVVKSQSYHPFYSPLYLDS